MRAGDDPVSGQLPHVELVHRQYSVHFLQQAPLNRVHLSVKHFLMIYFSVFFFERHTLAVNYAENIWVRALLLRQIHEKMIEPQRIRHYYL